MVCPRSFQPRILRSTTVWPIWMSGAVGSNPVSLVVPCHRVVNSDGTLGGYSGGGPDMKRRLIAIETGQIGLALGDGPRETRERIRFLLDSEAGDGG